MRSSFKFLDLATEGLRCRLVKFNELIPLTLWSLVILDFLVRSPGCVGNREFPFVCFAFHYKTSLKANKAI